MPIHVTTTTTQSLSNKTFVDYLSTFGIVYANSGNSEQWNGVFSIVQANSADWNYQGSDIKALTGNWQNTYTNFSASSGKYESAYTTINSQSATNASVHSTVNANSADWNYQGTDIKALTASWQNTYTNFSAQSAANASVYTQVNSLSDSWGTGGSPQTLSFNESNAQLTISDGNTVSLSALSGAAVATSTGCIGITIDGGGSAITTGYKGFISIPYDATITAVTLLADTAGSIVIDIWKDTYANYPPTVLDSITVLSKPTLTATDKYTDSTLTGWITTINAGDVLAFNVDSASTVTKITLTLKVNKQ